MILLLTMAKMVFILIRRRSQVNKVSIAPIKDIFDFHSYKLDNVQFIFHGSPAERH